MKSTVFLLAFAILAAVALAIPTPQTRVSYSGHRLLQLTPSNEDELALIKEHLAREDLALDEWTHHLEVGSPIDILFSPAALQSSARTLLAKVPFSIKIADLGPIIQESYKRVAAQEVAIASGLVARQATSVFADYQPAATYVSFLTNAGGSLFSIGNSFLGTPIQGVRIGTGAKKVLFHGGIHAREWISPAVTTYIAHQLITNSSYADLRSAFTFYVIPVLNVDGYAFTRSSNRLWRKNRQTNPGSTCVGDLNRNFGYQWGGASTSTNPCDNQIYRGKTPFEAVETKLVANFLTSLGSVTSYIDFHAYSQLWMSPYGYSCGTNTPDIADQRAAGAAAVAALRSVNGISFSNSRACDLYAASGVSVDWTYQTAKIKYSYAVELRDTGRNGFVLPPAQIIPSGKETTAAVAALWRYALTKP